jgi:hypothetical protein
MSFILTDDHLREHLGHMVEAIGKATLPNMTDHLSHLVGAMHTVTSLIPTKK